MKTTAATPEQKLTALAELEGLPHAVVIADHTGTLRVDYWLDGEQFMRTKGNYLTSLDAIMPLVKQQPHHKVAFIDALWSIIQPGCTFKRTREHFDYADMSAWIMATPEQICDALLIATGRFEP